LFPIQRDLHRKQRLQFCRIGDDALPAGNRLGYRRGSADHPKRTSPSQGSCSGPPLLEESAGYGHGAHPEIPPLHLSQPHGGCGTGASLGGRSGQAYGDEGEPISCPLQQQMIPQEEREQCEYADGPDDSGRCVCICDDDEEAQT